MNKNKNKGIARKIQICIGLMERWIKTRTKQLQGNTNLYLAYGKVNKNKNKGNARKIQICIGLMERYIKTRTREMQGKCKFVLGL